MTLLKTTMGRTKVEIRGRQLFNVKIPVRITDINYGNHTGNDAIVSIMHEARVAWLYSMGSSELNFHGVSLILAGLTVEYVNESFYGDMLEASLFAGDTSSAGFELLYLLTCKRDEKELVIARAKTDMVCFNYQIRKVTGLPDSVKALLT